MGQERQERQKRQDWNRECPRGYLVPFPDPPEFPCDAFSPGRGSSGWPCWLP
jgi:hypothetical protein